MVFDNSDLVLRRASNGFIITLLVDSGDGQPSVATTVDDLLEQVRAWAAPPKPVTTPRRARKH